MSSVVHKGQIQVVEGSPSGDFYVKTILGYNDAKKLIYVGTQKTNTTQNENRCFIEKLIYDELGLFQEILIAQNLTSLGCTNVTIKKLSPNVAEITPNNGVGIAEIYKDDSFNLTSTNNTFSGIIVKKVNNSLHVRLNSDFSIVDETITINEFDLIVRLENELTKDYTKRRWANRTTYLYA